MRTLKTMLVRQPSSNPLRDLAEEPHGGRLLQARRSFPNAPEPFIDLSTGINPFHYPLPPIPADAWTRLPEPEEIAALEEAAAAAYGAADASVAAAIPGTQTLISLLPSLFPQRTAAILAPTYNEYAHAFAAAGSQATEVAALSELEDAPVAILCNPNNPDGRRFDAGELLALLEARQGRGLLIVDESFVDLEDGALSLVPRLPLPGLLVLRSLSKSYGLGGLRLGFALAAPELAASIRASFGPWPVSGPAIEIGIKALADGAWRAAARSRLHTDVRRLDVLLHDAGLEPVGGTLLFRLAAGERAGIVYDRLGEAGILVRKFKRQPSWLRFGIPGDEATWQRLARTLA
jgi:cobalamin biosynthetic protein CobC